MHHNKHQPPAAFCATPSDVAAPCVWQVLLAAWILDAELDDVRVEAVLSALAGEMKAA